MRVLVLFILVVAPQPFLTADGFRLCRLDGTMTNKQRQAELKRFSGKGDKAGEGAEVRKSVRGSRALALSWRRHLPYCLRGCFFCLLLLPVICLIDKDV